MKALHETILDDQNRLTQENVKLTEELNKLKEENTQAIAMKNKVSRINAWIFNGEKIEWTVKLWKITLTGYRRIEETNS